VLVFETVGAFRDWPVARDFDRVRIPSPTNTETRSIFGITGTFSSTSGFIKWGWLVSSKAKSKITKNLAVHVLIGTMPVFLEAASMLPILKMKKKHENKTYRHIEENIPAFSANRSE
jgi:hypothetical protein